MGTRVGSIQPQPSQQASLVVLTRSWQVTKRMIRNCKISHSSSLNPTRYLAHHSLLAREVMKPDTRTRKWIPPRDGQMVGVTGWGCSGGGKLCAVCRHSL